MNKFLRVGLVALVGVMLVASLAFATTYKDAVQDFSNLPTTGNTSGDVRIVSLFNEQMTYTTFWFPTRLTRPTLAVTWGAGVYRFDQLPTGGANRECRGVFLLNTIFIYDSTAATWSVLQPESTITTTITASAAISAGTTITAGTGLTVTTGGITVVAGDSSIAGNVTLTTGGLYISTGGVAARTDLETSAGNVKVANNYLLSAGTTTATAATKATLGYLSTDAVGHLTIGTSANPQVISATAASLVKMSEMVVNLTGTTSCDDLLINYKKINVIGAGDSGTTPVVDRSILNVGLTGGANNSVIAEGYVRQDTLTHAGTGAVTGQLTGYSIDVNLGSDNFTNGSGINGLDIILEGTATTTGVKGISVDVKTGRVVDSAITCNMQTTSATAIEITGAPISEMTLSSGLQVFTGTAVTRAAVEAAPGCSAAAVGAVYISTGNVSATKPNMYIKNTSTTWVRIVTQDSD